MSDYVQLGEARTYYEVDGVGDPLVLLHPGGADSRAMEVMLPGLTDHFQVFRPDRRGHGRSPDVDGPISYQSMAMDTIAFLDQVVGGPSDLVGHSDGALIAMLIAIQRPDLVDRLVMISGGFDKSGEAADMELDIDQVVQFLGTAYGEVSPDGEAHFPVVVAKIGELMKHEPHVDVAELGRIRARSLVMFSDDDLVTLEHAVAMYDAIPGAEFAVVPGTSHFLTQEKPHLVNALLLDFLTNEPVTTVAPIRRARTEAPPRP